MNNLHLSSLQLFFDNFRSFPFAFLILLLIPAWSTAQSACTADFSLRVDECGVATFTNLSLGDGLAYAWSFGDETGSDESDPGHTYASNGNYTVCLAIGSPECSDEICKDLSIQLDELAPRLDCRNIERVVPQGSDGLRVDYGILVDDPNATVQCIPAPNSLFPVGSTTVTCTATDLCGNEYSCSFQVIVSTENIEGEDRGVVADASPDGAFEEVFDRMGNSFSLEDLRITARSGQALCVSSGYFNLYFETGCGMEGSSPAEVARREVICQLFSDLSNFINPANNTVEVNIWVRKISSVPLLPPGVLGVASSFYTLPAGATSIGGLLHGQVWKTINAGVDAYTGVAYPLFSLGSGYSNNFFHGMIAFNFDDNSWHTDLSSATASNLFDLYTVGLHEATHALGFASLIDDDGNSRINAYSKYYSYYDRFLETQAGLPLITGTGTCPMMYDYEFNPSLSTTVLQPDIADCQVDNTECADALVFSGSLSPAQAIYTPNCFEAGSSLSHLEDLCRQPTAQSNNEYYLMSNATGPGSTYMKRYLKEEERQVLCDLGYAVNLSYGNVGQFTDFNYSGGACPGLGVAGVNDGITNTNTYAYVTDAGVGLTIPISDILNNDYQAASLDCLEKITGNGSLTSITGTDFTYLPNSGISAETVLLRYIPVNTGGDKGNITYIFIRVRNDNCSAPPCELISNGDFELGSTCGLYKYADCWTPLTGSTDIYERGCSQLPIPTPTAWASPPADTWDMLSSNTRFAGLGAFFYGSHIESLQNQLAHPIVPGKTYTLSFYARIADGSYNLNVDAFLTFGGSISEIVPVMVSDYGSLGGVVPLHPTTTAIPIPATPSNQWQPYSFTFQYTGTDPLNYLHLACHPSNGYRNYVFIDEVSLVIEEMLSFAPPTPLCANDPPVNLGLYATPAGGIFSGPGVSLSGGNYIFDPTAAGTGIHSITYQYTNSIGCPTEIYANIEVTPDTGCVDCCELNRVTATYVQPNPNEPDRRCCWNLTLENYCEDAFSGVNLCLSDGQFASTMTSSGWTKYNFGSQKVSLLPPTTYIPSGSPISIGQVCIDNYSSVPQVIDVIFQDANFEDTDCRDRLLLDCPVIPPPDPLCLNAVMDTMICKDGVFTYTFFVENINPDPSFCIKYIEMLPGPGFTVSPSSFLLSTPLCPGDPKAGPFTVTVSGANAISGKQFCYQLEGHDTDIKVDPGSNCCRDFQEFCLEIPDCCDCEDDLTVFAVPKGDGLAECCYQLEVGNNYCDPIQKIEVTITTPGVTFDQITPQSGWSYSLLNAGQTLIFEPFPPGGTAPIGTFLLPEFCLKDYGLMTTILIKYYGTDAAGKPTIFCEERLPLKCPPDTDCIRLLDMQLTCRADGDFDLTFVVFNNSSFVAGEVELLPFGGSFTIPSISIAPLNPGSTSPPITITLNYSDVTSLSPFCLKAKIWEIVNGKRGDCCTAPELFCTTVPDCPRCTCGDWTHSLTEINGVDVGGSPCGQTYTILAGQSVNIQQSFNCVGTQRCQAPTYLWEYSSGGSTIKTTADLTGFFPTPGTYCFRITPICDGKKCTPCYICIRVLPNCNCGQWGTVKLLDPDAGTSTPTTNGGGYSLTCNRNYSLSGNYFCSPLSKGCQPTYKYTISGSGGVINSGTSNNPLNIPLNFPTAGSYTLTVIPICGGKECERYTVHFRVNCASDCCTGNNYTDLAIVQDGITYDFAGNGDDITIGCITPATTGILFRGTFNCGPECRVKSFRYELQTNGGATITAVNLDPATLPNFAIPINTAGLTPGKYRVQIIALCEDANGHLTKCQLDLCFRIPPCGCICGPGQATLQVMLSHFLSCKRTIKVSGLENCDKVNWAYRKLPAGPWISAGISVGNANKTILFPGSGHYEIRAIVSRIDANGNLCQTETIALKTLYVNCGFISKGGDKPIKNGGFAVGVTTGVLGLDGAAEPWRRLAGLPLVFKETGCRDDGFVLLEDNGDVMDGIYQAVHIEAGKTYQLDFCFKTPLAPNASPGSTRTKFIFNAHVNEPNGNNCGGDCTPIGTTEPLFGFEWDSYRFPKWTADRDYRYISVSPWLFGRRPDTKISGFGAVDNIVLREVSPDECDAEDVQIGSIPEGNHTYRAEKTFESTLIVTPERALHVRAGERLRFLPGFEVQAGARFSATTSSCEAPCDLVINGDFADGNSGFTSDFPENCTCLSGTYCIGQNAKRDKCNNSFWQQITSPNADNYLIVDGGGGKIWGQTVEVTAGQNYRFAFDLYPNLSGSGGPVLRLMAGRGLVASDVVGIAGQWTTLAFNWTPPNSGEIEIAIYEDDQTGFNDYGLDNIQFSSCETAPEPFRAVEPDIVESKMPGAATLRNYPNPFSGSTVIAVTLPKSTQAALTVVDINGKPVFRRAGNFEPGLTEIEFDAGALAPGLYFYQLQTKDNVLTNTMMIMR